MRGLDLGRGKRRERIDPSQKREGEGLSLKTEEKGKGGLDLGTERTGPGQGEEEPADQDHQKRQRFGVNSSFPIFDYYFRTLNLDLMWKMEMKTIRKAKLSLFL